MRATMLSLLMLMLTAACLSGQEDPQTEKLRAEQEYLNTFLLAHSYLNDLTPDEREDQVRAALSFYQAQQNQRVSDYWIGVQCVQAEASKVTSDHPIAADFVYNGGLLINSVTDDSPASDAGLQQGDVIVAFNQQRVDNIAALVAAIEAAGESECPVEVLRDGRFQALTVVPAEREQPVQDEAEVHVGWELPLLDSRMQLAKAWLTGGQLPKDVELTITIKNGSDVQLRAKRGVKVWKVDQSKLDELPQDIQAYVAPILNTISTNSIYAPYLRSNYDYLLDQKLRRQQLVQNVVGVPLQPLFATSQKSMNQQTSGKSASQEEKINELAVKIDELTEMVLELKKANDK